MSQKFSVSLYRPSPRGMCRGVSTVVHGTSTAETICTLTFVLDWTPKLSSLETIIRTAWQWHASVEARMEERDLTGQFRGFAERRAPLETKPHLGDIN